MKKLTVLFFALFLCVNLFVQGQEAVKKLTHTPGSLSVTIWNDGLFGRHHEPSLSGSFSWNGINGAFGASCCFGTKSANSINGIAAFGAYFIDMKNVTSNFTSGFTEETVGSITFDQVTTAVIRDDNATVPYGIDVIQKTYSVTGENVVFCRNGYVNTTATPIIDFYGEIGGDLDIGNAQANGGGVDTTVNLAYVYEPGDKPYFGFAAFNNLSGCKVGATKYNTIPQLREAIFTMTSTIDLKPPHIGDQLAVIGSFIGDIAVGDTAWVTFAILAGNDLAGLRANAVRAFEIAKNAGWTDKTVLAYTGEKIVNVPGDQPTIQTAINASVDGDTVLVADGTYFENINFRGKAITVASHFLFDGDESHIDSTVINGSKPSHPDSGSVVQFQSGEDTTSVLCGFTITGGTGNPDPHGFGSLGGGGIGVTKSGAKIQHNKITDNTITHQYAVGGGIVISTNSNPVLVLDNEIINNRLFETGIEPKGGGGIFCFEAKGDFILIANNVISGNVVSRSNGSLTGYGGGISLEDSKATICKNLIKNNRASFGGGIGLVDNPPSEKPILVNNTIINNEALSGGGIIRSKGSMPKILNSILWGNTAPNNPQIRGIADIQYSNVEGSYTGDGNIDLDPLFADTANYYLSNSSPCVDAGNPDTMYSDVEDPNNLGSPLPPSLGGLRNDMGYCGGDPQMNDIGTSIALENNSVPKAFELKQNYPNPFNPSTKIEYRIKETVLVSLKIYDVLGREVSTLVNQQQKAGYYEVEWDALNKSSGVYFYKITAGKFVDTKKMILLR